MSVDHLQQQDRPVPNKQHKESHSLKRPKNRWWDHWVMTTMSGLPFYKKRSWRHSNHTKYQQQPLVELRMWQLIQAYHCGMVSIVKRNSAQSSVVTQQGQNLKLKGCYCFLKRKNGGVEHNKVPERPFASEVKWCRWTLYLIVPHIIQLDSHILALVNKKDVSDCIEMNSVVGEYQLVEKRILCVRAWANDPSNQCQKINDISWGLFCRWLEAEWEFVIKTYLLNRRYSTFASNW